jgi:colicin import membrane protein
LSADPTSRPGTWRSWAWSIALHLFIAALVVVGLLTWRRAEPPGERLAIEAHVVTSTPVRAARPPPDPVQLPEPEPEPVLEPEPEVPPPPDPEEVAREIARAEEVARVEAEQRLLAQKAEEARLQQAREQADKEKVAREKAEREKAEKAKAEKDKADKERVQREKEQREKAEKEKAEREKAAAEKQRLEREAELNAQIAAEERLAAARASGKMDQYAAQITARIERAWIRPPSARPGLECEVRVTQVPGGAVVSARVTRCNGDDAVRESIEAAVYRASPLPLPPDPALFERNLVVTFRPED